MSIIINLFGDGIRYWICDIPAERFDEMVQYKTEQNIEWEQFFYDLSCLKKFGFHHWSELATRGEHKCFLLNTKNRIEIKKRTKLLERIITIDLDNKRTFIPLYETKIIENLWISKLEGLVTFVLAQKETGLFSKYEIPHDKLLIADLVFEIIEQLEGQDLNGLSSIAHKGEVLKQLSDDTVVRGSSVWFF